MFTAGAATAPAGLSSLQIPAVNPASLMFPDRQSTTTNLHQPQPIRPTVATTAAAMQPPFFTHATAYSNGATTPSALRFQCPCAHQTAPTALHGPVNGIASSVSDIIQSASPAAFSTSWSLGHLQNSLVREPWLPVVNGGGGRGGQSRDLADSSSPENQCSISSTSSSSATSS